MKKHPDCSISFYMDGMFDVNEFTEIIQINPDECAMKEKNCHWELKYSIENYDDFDTVMRDIMGRLQGKEDLIIEYCKKHDLERTLSIGIVGKITYFPDIVLSPDVSLFFGRLNTTIDIDTVAYR